MVTMPKPTQGSCPSRSRQEPRERLKEHDDGEHEEDARGPGHGCALAERPRLGDHLGLGELYLLTNQQRGLFGDLRDDLAERLLGAVRARRSHLPITLMNPARNSPPTKAAPT